MQAHDTTYIYKYLELWSKAILQMQIGNEIEISPSINLIFNTNFLITLMYYKKLLNRFRFLLINTLYKTFL